MTGYRVNLPLTSESFSTYLSPFLKKKKELTNAITEANVSGLEGCDTLSQNILS
jgi:hypothetical protein